MLRQLKVLFKTLHFFQEMLVSLPNIAQLLSAAYSFTLMEHLTFLSTLRKSLKITSMKYVEALTGA